MYDTIETLPFSFWVGMALLLYGTGWAARRVATGVGLPMLAVFGTVFVWYMGDAFYNDYANYHATLFSDQILDDAWWQVAWFIAIFFLLTPLLNRSINAPYLRQRSHILQLFRKGVDDPLFQRHLHALFKACLIVWGCLACIAVLRLQSQSLNFFFPVVGYRADPWGRGRVGGGMDAFLSLASYLQMFVSAAFGIVAALVKDRRIRIFAICLCLVTWPYYIFDRTRNTMLSVVLPSVLAWTFLRLRGNIVQKVSVLCVCFLAVNAWFGFVISNRSDKAITAAFMQEGFDFQQSQSVRHEGLNMFEELCWINFFFKEKTYNPSWGERYFAELANPIPRSLWPGKPTIGIDYAVARGQALEESGEGAGATISTGMIGQGVVNFRQVLGPAFAALLMSLWAVLLARLDLRGALFGRLPLFALGFILTFNLGRDITFITLYTFFFGWIIIWCMERFSKKPRRKRKITGTASRVNITQGI